MSRYFLVAVIALFALETFLFGNSQFVTEADSKLSVVKSGLIALGVTIISISWVVFFIALGMNRFNTGTLIRLAIASTGIGMIPTIAGFMMGS